MPEIHVSGPGNCSNLLSHPPAWKKLRNDPVVIHCLSFIPISFLMQLHTFRLEILPDTIQRNWIQEHTFSVDVKVGFWQKTNEAQHFMPIWNIKPIPIYLSISRCGRLVYYIPFPKSYVRYRFVEAAIASAYIDEPCGPCPTTPPLKKTTTTPFIPPAVNVVSKIEGDVLQDEEGSGEVRILPVEVFIMGLPQEI